MLTNLLCCSQVVAELPSLHQLSLRGCPIAEDTAYPDYILQHLPGLDVLDSKKLVKSGMQRHSCKPAAAATIAATADMALADVASVKPSNAVPEKAPSGVQQRAAGVQPSAHDKQAQAAGIVKDGGRKAKRQHKATDDGAGDDADVDGAALPAPAKKRRHAQLETADAAPASTAGQDVQTAQGTGRTESGLKKASKKTIKQGHKAEQQAGQQSAQGRSFLADVLDPEDDPVPAKQAATSAQPKAAPTKGLHDSGLLKVIDTLPTKQPKSKAGKHKSAASHAPSGSAAVELLQTGVGLNAFQVGLGSTSSWD